MPQVYVIFMALSLVFPFWSIFFALEVRGMHASSLPAARPHRRRMRPVE
jgi:hypothetical protein